MKRTILTIVFLTVAIAGLVFLFYKWVNKNDSKQFNPIDAIPLNSTMILNFDDFETFAGSVKANSWWNSVKGSEMFKCFATVVNFIDSAAKSDDTVRKITRGSNTIVAFYSQTPQRSEFLFSHKIPKDVNRSDIIELIKLQSLGLAKAEEISVAGNTAIYVEAPMPGSTSFTFTTFGNLLLVSNSQELLVESIGKLKKGFGTRTDEQFQAVFQTAASGVAANIFLNTNELSNVFSLEQNANAFKGIAHWVGLDVQVSPSMVIANGLVLNSPDGSDYYKIFTRQTPVQFTLLNYMPSSTSFFTWYGLPNISNFMTDYSDYIDNIGLTEPYNKNLSEFLRLTGISVDEFLAKNVDNEIAAISSRLANDSTEWYILVNTRSGSATLQQLQNFAKAKGFSKHEYKPSKQNSFLIVPNPIKLYLPTLLGNSFLMVNDSYVTAIDNVIVFGSSVSALEKIVNEYLRNNTLSGSAVFRDIQQRISTSSNFILYTNGMDSYPINGLRLHGKPFRLCKSNPADSHSLVWQVVGGSQKLFAMLAITSNQDGLTETAGLPENVKWVCKLNSVPVGKPHRLVNHINGQTEILVQDSNNQIYLISNDGHILWQRRIDAPIQGDVIQVDVFRNRKLQMVFTAGNAIYLIDRNGKDVQGFPVRLPANATSPLSAFDYDKNRNYRFVVACADKRIYCYDTNGKPVKGWFNFKTETVVRNRIGYVSYQGKDFIVIFDQNRPYLLNRRGEERVKPQTLFAKAPNAEFYLITNSRKGAYLVTTDTLGIINRLYFDGKVESMVLEPFSLNHTFRMAGKNYLILDKNRISIYGEAQLKNVILSPKGNFDSGSLDIVAHNRYLLASQNGNVVGFDLNGKPLNQFPISGTIPMVEVDAKNNFFVTLSKQNGVTCFAIK
ncbi:MAG: DUF3352 domain-containing protein [Bacteroidota bacterium]